MGDASGPGIPRGPAIVDWRPFQLCCMDLLLFDFSVKALCCDQEQAQNAEASPGLIEASAQRNKTSAILPGCVCPTLRYLAQCNFSWTDMFTCILKLQFSSD